MNICLSKLPESQLFSAIDSYNTVDEIKYLQRWFGEIVDNDDFVNFNKRFEYKCDVPNTNRKVYFDNDTNNYICLEGNTINESTSKNTRRKLISENRISQIVEQTMKKYIKEYGGFDNEFQENHSIDFNG